MCGVFLKAQSTLAEALKSVCVRAHLHHGQKQTFTGLVRLCVCACVRAQKKSVCRVPCVNACVSRVCVWSGVCVRDMVSLVALIFY